MNNQVHDILIVDDEPNVLTALRRMLYGEPYRVHVASDPKEAVEQLKSIEPAVMISDYRMPGMSGVAFLQEAKKMQPDSVRIILSGYADISAIIDAINKGEIFRFIAKPWNDDELKLTIKQSLEHWDLMKSNRVLSDELVQRNRELTELNENLEKEVARRSRDLLLKDKSYLLSKFIIEYTPIPLMGIDEDGMIALANRECSVLSSSPGVALLGRNIKTMLTEGDMEQLNEHRRQETQSVLQIVLNGLNYNLYCIPVNSAQLIGNTLLAFLELEKPSFDTNSSSAKSQRPAEQTRYGK